MIELMICYAILDGKLSEPLRVPVTYDHKAIAGLLQNHQYICSQRELDVNLYQAPKTVREKLRGKRKQSAPYSGP